MRNLKLFADGGYEICRSSGPGPSLDDRMRNVKVEISALNNSVRIAGQSTTV
ncbi:MAG TPA: hypothetical protein VKB50_12210 [Vicinamibacterales bacterium]|nr:hypothetical protein [Vicinamibacterales bacterium]